MAHDVFISYEKNDKAIADVVCAALEAAAIKCWIAPRDIVGKYGAAIIKGINTSKIMVLVLSSNANKSHFVEKEVERAASKGVVIYPLRVENVLPSEELELFISTEQWLDAWDKPVEQSLPSLIARIRQRLPPAPEVGERVTPKHLALAYRCWRDEEKDERFKKWDKKFKQRIYRLDLSIAASWEVLNRISYVEYFLHPSWGQAGSSTEYKIAKVESNFKLKELIWGSFLLYAEAQLKDHDVVPLSCFVQLPEEQLLSK
jgi:hypothetical protein